VSNKVQQGAPKSLRRDADNSYDDLVDTALASPGQWFHQPAVTAPTNTNTKILATIGRRIAKVHVVKGEVYVCVYDQKEPS
jgi:hypothetical protein